MFDDLLKLGRQSFVYGLSTAIGRMVTLITAPILTRIFEPADYGIVALVQTAVSLAIIFAGLNLGSGLTYYFFHYNDETTRKKVISTGFLIITIFASIIACLFYSIAADINNLFNLRASRAIETNLTHFLEIASISMLFGIIMTATQSILRILEKPKCYFFVELTTLFTNLCSVMVLVVWMRQGVTGVFWSGAISSFFGMLLGLFYVRDKLEFNFSIALLAPMLLYALPQLPGVIVNWAQSQTGRLFINYYTTLEEQGLYAIAFALGSILMIGTTAFRLAYDPYSMSIMKRDDAKQIYAMFYSIYSFLAFILLGGLVGFAKPALMILTPQEYHNAHFIVFWIVGAAFLMGANNILGTGIWITRRTIYTSYAQICTFFTVIPASFILVPKFLAVGAAMAYFIGTLTQSLTYYIFAQRLYRIPYRYWQVQSALGLSLVLAWIHSEAVNEKTFTVSILYGLITFFIITVVAFIFSFNRDTRENILSYLRGLFYNWRVKT